MAGSTGRSGYIASLDGWRALAIAAVLFNHSRPFSVRGYSLRHLQDFGGEGVVIFFAISGLLICTRLLEEEQILGRVNLRGFYLRRVLRIQPAAIVYLVAVAVVVLAGWFPQDWSYWWGALFLYRNYQTHLLNESVEIRGFLTGHFWTLAVEEHFYLLLSLFLYFVRSRREWILAAAFLLAFFYPGLVTHFRPSLDESNFVRHTEFQIQYLIPSALLALLLFQPRFRLWTERWLQPLPVIAGTIAVAALSALLHGQYAAFFARHYGPMHYVLGPWYVIYERMFPFWVLATATHGDSACSRLLERPALRWVGRVSYSLYLWHVLFFRGSWPASVAQPPGPLILLTAAPWNLVASIACAVTSFYLLERPFMRLGHRLAPPSTPGRLDLQQQPSVAVAVAG